MWDGVRCGPVESEQRPQRAHTQCHLQRESTTLPGSHAAKESRDGKIQTDRQTGGCDQEKTILHSHVTQAPCPVTVPHATERGTFMLSPDLTPTTCMALDR